MYISDVSRLADFLAGKTCELTSGMPSALRICLDEGGILFAVMSSYEIIAERQYLRDC